MFALGNSLFACGVRSARERSFEEARGKTEVGRRLLAPEPRPLPPLALSPRTRPAGTPTEPLLEPATPAGVILPETEQFLLLCSRFGVAVTRWSRSTQLLYIEPG